MYVSQIIELYCYSLARVAYKINNAFDSLGCFPALSKTIKALKLAKYVVGGPLVECVVWLIVLSALPRFPGPGLRLGRLPQTVWC